MGLVFRFTSTRSALVVLLAVAACGAPPFEADRGVAASELEQLLPNTPHQVVLREVVRSVSPPHLAIWWRTYSLAPIPRRTSKSMARCPRSRTCA